MIRLLISVILLAIFINHSNVYSYTIEELYAELDTPQWLEKVSEPLFIEKFRQDKTIKTVIEFADSKGIDWRFRIRAIKLLGNTGTSVAQKALLDMFQDPFFHNECPSLKLYLADALGNFPPSRRHLEILKDGLKDREVLVREATARALGRLKIDDAAIYLKEAFLTENSIAVKIAIIYALRDIGTSDALNFIKDELSNGKNNKLKEILGHIF